MERGEIVTGFKLDMVLVDSRALAERAYQAMAEQEELDPAIHGVMQEEGSPIDLKLVEYVSPDEATRLANIFRGNMRQMGFGLTRLMPGAADAVRAAVREGQAAVLTARPQDLTVGTLAYHGIDGPRVYGGLSDGETVHMLQELNADVYVGFRPIDMEVARDAGVELVVGVTTGGYDMDLLQSAGAGLVLSSLRSFPEQLGAYAASKVIARY